MFIATVPRSEELRLATPHLLCGTPQVLLYAVRAARLALPSRRTEALVLEDRLRTGFRRFEDHRQAGAPKQAFRHVHSVLRSTWEPSLRDLLQQGADSNWVTITIAGAATGAVSRWNRTTWAESPMRLSNGVTMPRFGLGTTMLEGVKGQAAMEKAIELGYRLIDSAQAYNNEQDVGNAWRRSLKKGHLRSRDELFLVTKLSEPDSYVEGTREVVREQLQKLQTDYVDLYFLHGPDGDWPGIEGSIEAWKSLEVLYHNGTIRALGISNFSPAQARALAAATSVPPRRGNSASRAASA